MIIVLLLCREVGTLTWSSGPERRSGAQRSLREEGRLPSRVSCWWGEPQTHPLPAAVGTLASSASLGEKRASTSLPLAPTVPGRSSLLWVVRRSRDSADVLPCWLPALGAGLPLSSSPWWPPASGLAGAVLSGLSPSPPKSLTSRKALPASPPASRNGSSEASGVAARGCHPHPGCPQVHPNPGVLCSKTQGPL